MLHFTKSTVPIIFRYYEFNLTMNRKLHVFNQNRRNLLQYLILPAIFILLTISALSQNTGTTLDSCGFGAIAQIKHPNCAGFEDGRIAITVTSSLSVNYIWINLPVPITSNSAANLKQGTYRVVLASPTCRDTLEFRLQDPPALLAPPIDTAICAQKGQVNLLSRVQGGTGDYRLSASTLFGTAFDCTNCAETAAVIEQTSLYNVQIRDQNNCQVSRTVFAELLDTLKNTALVKDETCTRNGAVTMRTSGGSGRYLYAFNNSTVLQSDTIFRQLRGDTTYTIRVLDQRGCALTDTVRVRYVPSFTPATLAVQDVSCFNFRNGQIRVSIPADAPVTGYALNALNATAQTEPVFRNLSPGEYKVFVIEGSDCYVTYPARVAEPEPLSLNLNIQDANCPGASDGSVQLITTGGNGSYRYSLNGMEFQSRNFFGALPAGTYRISVRDTLNCNLSEIFTIDEPESPPLGTLITPSCPEQRSGRIVIVESGKLLIGQYEFSLDSLNWQRENGFANLAPGLYQVWVRYPDGCVHKVSALVPEVPAPGISLRIQPVSCPGATDGSVLVEFDNNASAANYMYSLDGVQFVAQNGFKNLAASNYIIYLRDTFQCVFQFPFLIEAPPAPALDFQITNPTCFNGKNGSLLMVAKGGRAPFTYALNSANFLPDSVFTALSAGSYAALVRDASGCIFGETIQIGQPPQLQIQFTVINETCGNDNGIAVGFPMGGIPPYRFKWNTGDTTLVIAGLTAGAYALTVSDVNNCIIESKTEVNNLPGPVVLGELTDIPCNGQATGAIQLTVIGGSAPLNYRWSSGPRTPNIYNLTAGSYTVTVTDIHQCLSIKTFQVFEPAPLRLSSQVGMQSEALWFINLIVEGGVPGYTYQWSHGETSEDVFNLAAGTYTVTVTDQAGCSQTLEWNVGLNATQEPAWAQTLQVYPNPTTGRIYLSMEATHSAGVQFQLHDMRGRAVQPPVVFRGPRHETDITNLPAGVYLLRIEHAGSIICRKIVKL